MTTFRAAYYDNSDVGGVGTLLTGEADAHLPDAELIAKATKEAEKNGLIGDDPHQVPREKFEERLTIGDWTE